MAFAFGPDEITDRVGNEFFPADHADDVTVFVDDEELVRIPALHLVDEMVQASGLGYGRCLRAQVTHRRGGVDRGQPPQIEEADAAAPLFDGQPFLTGREGRPPGFCGRRPRRERLQVDVGPHQVAHLELGPTHDLREQVGGPAFESEALGVALDVFLDLLRTQRVALAAGRCTEPRREKVHESLDRDADRCERDRAGAEHGGGRRSQPGAQPESQRLRQDLAEDDQAEGGSDAERHTDSRAELGRDSRGQREIRGVQEQVREQDRQQNRPRALQTPGQ